jgi:ATP-binding cassette subfamily B (MDR/TAP) protein 1
VFLAIGTFVTNFGSTAGFMWVGDRIAQRIREEYLAAMLRQNIAFFDNIGPGEVTTRITENTMLIQDGISEKAQLTLYAFASFISAFVVGFVRFWKLSLILMSSVFLIVLAMACAPLAITRWTARAQEANVRGSSVAEEVLSSIRNATAFGTQEKLARKYDSHLAHAEKWGRKWQALLGVMISTITTIAFLSYALSFWQGARYITWGEGTLPEVLTTLFAVTMGAFALGNIAPNFKALTSAVAAARDIFATIDRSSPIDPTSAGGYKLDTVKGRIEFRNVKYIYPSRPDVVILDGINLVAPSGKTTAIVGASGSGNSTLIGLLERFYDPVDGEVLLDGYNIMSSNLKWFRQQMSLVQQESVLFATSIFNNIKYGLIGTEYEHASEEKVVEMVENAGEFHFSCPLRLLKAGILSTSLQQAFTDSKSHSTNS